MNKNLNWGDHFPPHPQDEFDQFQQEVQSWNILFTCFSHEDETNIIPDELKTFGAVSLSGNTVCFSSKVPENFQKYVGFHEHLCPIAHWNCDDPHGCVKVLEKELSIVASEDYHSYVLWRHSFYQGMLQYAQKMTPSIAGQMKDCCDLLTEKITQMKIVAVESSVHHSHQNLLGKNEKP